MLLDQLDAAATAVTEIVGAEPLGLGATLGAIRDSAGQLLEQAAAVPFVDLPSWTGDHLADRLRAVEKARHAWQIAGPYITATVWTQRFLRGAHPLWPLIATGLETAAERWTERYLAGLLEALVALVYVQLARACLPEFGRYTLDACALEEALRVHAAAPGIDANRRLLLSAIVTASLPDEAVRLELLRALGDDTAPGEPREYRELPAVARRALARRLSEVLGGLYGLADPAMRDVVAGLEARLGHGLALDYIASTVGARFKAQAGLSALAAVAVTRLGLPPDEAAGRLRETPFAEAVLRLLPQGADQEILEAVAQAQGVEVSVPRALCGDPVAGEWCDALVQLLDREPGPWCAADDELALVALSTLLPNRAEFEKRWRSHLGRARTRLREARSVGTLDPPDPATSRLILRVLPTDAALLDATHATTVPAQPGGKGAPFWVAFVEGEVLLGPVAPEGEWLAEVELTRAPAAKVTARRLRGITADDLELTVDDRRYIVEGAVSTTFRARFESLLTRTGLVIE